MLSLFYSIVMEKTSFQVKKGVRESKFSAREPEESGRKGPPRATSRPGSPCGLRYASRRPHPFCSPRPSSFSSFSIVSFFFFFFFLFSPRLTLLSSADINLGRLHLYLMLPISRLIPSPPSTAPFTLPSSLSFSFSLALRFLY